MFKPPKYSPDILTGDVQFSARFMKPFFSYETISVLNFSEKIKILVLSQIPTYSSLVLRVVFSSAEDPGTVPTVWHKIPFGFVPKKIWTTVMGARFYKSLSKLWTCENYVEN